MSFHFDDEERARIIGFMREQYGVKGLPKLATRQHLRDWVNEAVDAYWVAVDDVESSTEERKLPSY